MSETEARDSDDATPDAAPREAAIESQDDAPVDTSEEETPEETTPEEEPDEGPEPSWWHRSHPTFAGLVGFFAGVAYVIIVPGVYAALLGLLLGDSTAQKLFPLVPVALLVPIAMLVWRKTRRFAQFMLLGIVSTALFIAATASLVIWVIVKLDSSHCFSGHSQPERRTPRRSRPVLLYGPSEEVPHEDPCHRGPRSRSRPNP